MSRRDLFDRCVWLICGTAMWTVTLADRPTIESCSEIAHLSFIAESLPLFLLGMFLSIVSGYLLADKWPARLVCVLIGIIPLAWLMTWDKDGARSSISGVEVLVLYVFAPIPPSLGEIVRIIFRKLGEDRPSHATTDSQSS